MRPAVEPVLEVLDRFELRDPAIPVAENVTGELVRDAATLRDLLGRQVVSPVRWESGIHVLSAAGATTFLEAGPGDVLTKLMRRIDPEPAALAVGSPEAARDAV
jgi:[acyl-carrier-protein] S-malonyltransferase